MTNEDSIQPTNYVIVHHAVRDVDPILFDRAAKEWEKITGRKVYVDQYLPTSASGANAHARRR